MTIRLYGFLIVFVSLFVGCKASNQRSTEEGMDFHNDEPVDHWYKNLYRGLKDPQLQMLSMASGPIQIWLVPNFFKNKDLHICAYAFNDSENFGDVKAPMDTDTISWDKYRFLASKVLKGGKYMRFYTFLEAMSAEAKSTKWDQQKLNYFRGLLDLLKAERKKFDGPLENVLEDMEVRETHKVLGFIPDPRNKPQAQLASLLITLDSTETTGNDCPSPKNVLKKAESESKVKDFIQSAEPIRLK